MPFGFFSSTHLPEAAPGRRPRAVIAFRAWETSCFHARAGHPWPACRNHCPGPTSTRWVRGSIGNGSGARVVAGASPMRIADAQQRLAAACAASSHQASPSRSVQESGVGHVGPSGAGRQERRPVKNRMFFPGRGPTCPTPGERAQLLEGSARENPVAQLNKPAPSNSPLCALDPAADLNAHPFTFLSNSEPKQHFPNGC
jgi:hypothetical protein